MMKVVKKMRLMEKAQKGRAIVRIRLVNGAGVETEGTEGVDQGRDKVFLI